MTGRKVLLVDDEPLYCDMLRTFFGAKGYSVVEAYDCDQALAVYEQERPDVVLLDVRMAGKDGLETLRGLKALDPEASVVMVSAIPEEELVEQAKADGVHHYVAKPVDLEYLLSLLTNSGLLDASE